MDVKALLRDKKTLYVIGAGGVLGAVVLLRNGTGSASAAGAVNDAGVAGGTTPTFNDGGSDIAATLGNFSTELQGILENYRDGMGQDVPVIPGTKPTVPKPPVTKPRPITALPIKWGKPKPYKPPVKKPVVKHKTIIIKKGQTLTSIAKANHTTVNALAKLNGIKNKNLIYAGHKLKVS